MYFRSEAWFFSCLFVLLRLFNTTSCHEGIWLINPPNYEILINITEQLVVSRIYWGEKSLKLAFVWISISSVYVSAESTTYLNGNCFLWFRTLWFSVGHFSLWSDKQNGFLSKTTHIKTYNALHWNNRGKKIHKKSQMWGLFVVGGLRRFKTRHKYKEEWSSYITATGLPDNAAQIIMT